MEDKGNKLFIILASIFLCNALLAEFIGVKIFSLEQTLGFQSLDHLSWWKLPSFNLTAGVLLWPVVFILTDIINEYYGQKGIRFLSYLTVVLIIFAFLVINLAIYLNPADFWPSSGKYVQNMQLAYKAIFGQGAWIIAGSVIAFLIGQLLDVKVFHGIKLITGEKKLWLRATGSTLVSQLIDSFVVLFIAFYLSGTFTFTRVLEIGLVNYIYKFVVAIILTPLLYIIHNLIDNYLGKNIAAEMIAKAKQNKIML